jgi:hypothetical protein
MDVVTHDQLEALVRISEGPCVSLFQPTHRVGPDTRPVARADVIRFKNGLREIEQRLLASGSGSRESSVILEPARALLEDAEFWQYQSDGLALFVAPGFFRTYRVPLTVPELAVVAPRFHVKPLLSLLTGDGLFYVLALSQNSVRMFEATRDRISPLDVTGMPESLQEALGYDAPGRSLQFHTGAPRRAGRRDAIFHGHGIGVDDAKDRVLQYCQAVNRGLNDLLRGSEAPLVLAGVESVQSIYRAANTYPRLLGAGIAGNQDGTSAEDLHAAAWPLVLPEFHRAREAALASYLTLRGTGRATGDLTVAAQAAFHARVSVLFVPVGLQRWGRVDRQTGSVELHETVHPDDEDLLNVVAVQTILTRGTVYAVEPGEMPGETDIAAVFRY